MAVHYSALTVVLEEGMREGDVEELISAIRMMRPVKDVQPHVADNLAESVAYVRARVAFTKELYALARKLDKWG